LTGSAGSGGTSSGIRAWGRKNSHRDAVTQFIDPSNHLISIIIRLPTPYLQHPKPIISAFGLPDKPNYTTADVCKILKNNCETCLDRCPMGAIFPDDETVSVQRQRCIGCGLCISTSPSDALAPGKMQSHPHTWECG